MKYISLKIERSSSRRLSSDEGFGLRGKRSKARNGRVPLQVLTAKLLKN